MQHLTLQNTFISQRKNGKREDQSHRFIQPRPRLHMDDREKAEQEEYIQQQKHAHEKSHPGDTRILGVRNFLLDDRLIFFPPLLNEKQVTGELNHHDDPEKYTSDPTTFV